MLVQWQYLRNGKELIGEILIDESITLAMLKTCLKELDVVTTGWDPKPYG